MKIARAALMLLFSLTPFSAFSQTSMLHFGETGGEAIFKSVCAGCHMEDARGAKGAGAYPALRRDPKLGESGYPLMLVLHGRNAMPPIGEMMSDQQIADVINFLRTHFGNDYRDALTAADVGKARPVGTPS